MFLTREVDPASAKFYGFTGLLSFLIAIMPQTAQTECVRWSFALRKQSSACWAEFQLDARRRLCIDHAHWIQWLHLPTPPFICEDPHLSWRSFSPWVNSFEPNVRAPRAPFQKKTLLRQTLRHWVPYLQTAPSLKPWMKIRQAWELGLRKFFQQWELLREQLSQLLAPHDSLGILRSLILHEGSTRDCLSVLRKVGFVHLTTTSGIHLIAWLGLLDKGMRLFCFHLKIPVQSGIAFSRILGWSHAFFLWLLTGGRLGLLRPVLILIAREIAKTLGLRWRKGSPLVLALSFDLLWNHFISKSQDQSHASSGRWFYALAIGGGLLWYPCFRSIHFGLAVGSWLGVVLWEIWKTGTVSLATPLISMITLPIICTFIYPLTLLSLLLSPMGFTDLAQTLVFSLSQMLNGLTLKLTVLAMHPGNIWMIPKWALYFGIVLSGFLTGFGFNLKQHWKILFILVGMTLSLRVGIHISKSYSSLMSSAAHSIYQLDVGQGDAALILSNQAGLVDTGSSHSLSDTAWIEILGQMQIQRISWIALTHLDEDHAGGLIKLARLIPIDCVSTPYSGLDSKKGIRFIHKLRQAGLIFHDWTSPCIPFPTLAPPSPLLSSTDARFQPKSLANQNMGALWIPLSSGGFYLSAGDASARDEIRIGKWASQLAKQSPTPLPQRILKINHHGSKNSSTIHFLKTIDPTEAWISVGRNNRYGHPALSTLKRIEILGIPIRRTDEEGSIVLNVLLQ